MVLEKLYNIFRLLIGVPDYGSSHREKQKLIGFIVIISQRGVAFLEGDVMQKDEQCCTEVHGGKGLDEL